MLERSEWIKGCEKNLRGGTVYLKNFRCAAKAEKAILEITALGVYEAKLNGERVGDFILAPGWTSYLNRLQVQSYDVTDMLKTENSLEVTVGQGWRAIANKRDSSDFLGYRDTALIAELTLVYADGRTESIVTDSSWTARESKLRYTNIYDGDIYDATFKAGSARHCICVDLEKDMLIPQEGEKIVEHERMPALQIIKTPAGETVIDFGQNMTGYVEFSIKGTPGAQATISHGETLDCDGNFYNANYRSARAQIKFTCDGEEHTYKSALTFFGFRYIRLENWPDEIKKENFTAVVVHSDIRRTGYFECSDEAVNRLFKNIIWGQKGNFLDVPTDCPQRDERLGWTGDAQVFVRTASLNFDVECFFKKWLHDLAADQGRDGCVLALYFDITDDRAATAAQLNELVKRAGHLETGFVGTPYLLHALSDNGYVGTAYDLLLRREYPSWLYPISKGATTVWEHWDGIKPDGTMWSTDMNSFNHYAYGAVADWMYGAAAGINSDPDRPGFEHIIFRPVTDRRLDFVKASIDTRRGTVASEWRRENGRIKYIFTVPESCCASAVIGGEKHEVGAGTHEFLE